MPSSNPHSPSSTSSTLVEMESLADLASPKPVEPGRPLPPRKLASLDDFSMTTAADESTVQCQIGVLKVPRLHLLRRLTTRITLACTSLFRRRRRDSPASSVLDSPHNPSESSLELEQDQDHQLDHLLDGQPGDELDDLAFAATMPRDAILGVLKYDPVKHAGAAVDSHLYVTDEVYDYIFSKLSQHPRPFLEAGERPLRKHWIRLLDIVQDIIQDARRELPPTPQREHSICTCEWALGDAIVRAKVRL
ncbi:hypothetical protein JCM8208_003867 [Rhodotorula glutinis]